MLQRGKVTGTVVVFGVVVDAAAMMIVVAALSVVFFKLVSTQPSQHS